MQYHERSREQAFGHAPLLSTRHHACACILGYSSSNLHVCVSRYYRHTSLLSVGFLPVGIQARALNNAKTWYVLMKKCALIRKVCLTPESTVRDNMYPTF